MPATDTTTKQSIFRGARMAVALLLVINTFNFIDRYVLTSAGTKISEELLAGDPNAKTKFGFLSTVFLLTYMIAAPVFGYLSDRMSRWLLIGLAVIVWSLASGSSGMATTYGMLLLSRIVVGVGEAAYGPAAPTIISDLYPAQRRAGVLAWFYMAMPIGGAIGYALGGAFAGHGMWRIAFYATIPPGLALGVWALFMRDPPRGANDGIIAQGKVASFADYTGLAKIPSYVFDTIGMIFMSFAIGGVSYWMPIYIVEYRHVSSESSVGFIFGAITAVTGIVATLLGGYVADKLRAPLEWHYFIVAGVSMIAAFPFFLAILFTPFPLAWVMIFATEFCMFFSIAPTNTILANVTHPAVRASAFALNIFLIHALGDAISPTLIGFISDRTAGNMNLGMSSVSISILLSGIFWLLGTRYLERDMELAPSRITS